MSVPPVITMNVLPHAVLGSNAPCMPWRMRCSVMVFPLIDGVIEMGPVGCWWSIYDLSFHDIFGHEVSGDVGVVSGLIAPDEIVKMPFPLPKERGSGEKRLIVLCYLLSSVNPGASILALVDEFLSDDRDLPPSCRVQSRIVASLNKPEPIVAFGRVHPHRQRGGDSANLRRGEVNAGSLNKLLLRTDVLVLGTDRSDKFVFGLPAFHKLRKRNPDNDWHDVSSVLESLCRPPVEGIRPVALDSTTVAHQL